MPFDPRRIEADLSLQRISPEKMPELAWDALEAGYDGPAIRRLAALDNPGGWEVDRILPAFREETGMQLLSTREAALRVAYDLACETLERRADDLAVLPAFESLSIRSEYPAALVDLFMLADEIYLNESTQGRSLDQVRQDTRDAMITFVRNYKAEHNIP